MERVKYPWESNNTCLQQGEDDTQTVEGFGELNTTNINISRKPFLKGMVMACLNINSLLAHIDELSIYISSRKIDILCINETKLDHTINDREVCLPGFEIVRRDRKVNGRNGGGVCLYIRSNINYKVRYDLQSEILENLIVEITKPRSKSILVSTWYRPPDCPVSLFNEFETMIGALDAENLEFFLLGDLNVDFKPSIKSSNKSTLAELFDIYGLSQIIEEPTRITEKSSTMIDLCLTNTLSTVVDSGVIHLSISDHSMVYIVRKAHYFQTGIRVVESRSMKKFNRDSFLNDLRQQPWGNVYHHGNPNEMWGTWKALLMNVIDKHAPLRTRRVSNKRSPWVTNDLKHLMFNRDYLKKRAISSRDPEKWCEYRHARNQVNNEIKKAKRLYFTKNLDIHKGDMKRSWKLINELNSRNFEKTKRIPEIKIGEQVVTSSGEIAETFNSYFSNIRADLAAEIPASEYKPENYLIPTDKTFNLEIATIDTVHRLLKTIDEKKSPGLDKIPTNY